MQKIETYIKTKEGLRSRAAASFVQQTNKFISDIYINYQGTVIDAKSIMGILALGISEDCQVTITIEGVDETQAKQVIVHMIEHELATM